MTHVDQVVVNTWRNNLAARTIGPTRSKPRSVCVNIRCETRPNRTLEPPCVTAADREKLRGSLQLMSENATFMS